jgi:hypothetical protein
MGSSSLSDLCFVIFGLSHKRNSKAFDQRNRRAATSSHDETPQTHISWTRNRVRLKRNSFGANDDQRGGRDLSVSDLLEVVRCIREGGSVCPI